MKVRIIASSWFKRYTGGLSSLEVELPEGGTAWQAVCRAGIPHEQIGFIAVQTAAAAESDQNNAKVTRVDEAYMAADGDVIRVYPTIIGG